MPTQYDDTNPPLTTADKAKRPSTKPALKLKPNKFDSQVPITPSKQFKLKRRFAVPKPPKF